MKRYKLKFENYKRLSLLEAVVNPNNYLADIEKKLDKFINKIQGKDYKASKICFKLGWDLASNRIRCEYENKIIPNIDPSPEYGINNGACLPDKKTTIRLGLNSNILNIQKDIKFANGFKTWFLYVLKHELIHRGQFLAIKNYKIRAQVMVKDNSSIKKQLEDKQEIMARAWEIVEYFKLINNFSKDKIKEVMKNYSKYNMNEVISMYIHLFGQDSKELKLLYKYMYEYLEV
jgi:hypothetical protein